MPLVFADDKKVFFAHVPKTGGTTVEDYLIRRFGRLTLLDRHKKDHVPGTGLITSATHLSALDLEELLPEPLDYSFTMVRDPVARLQSEYRYQSEVSRTTRASFATWLRVMLACLAREPRVYDNHIRPQSDLVPEGAEVFKLEEGGMEAMVRRLDEVLGSTAPEVRIASVNESKVRTRAALTKQDVAAIEDAYAVDYDRFGFARTDPSELPDDPRALARRATARALAPVVVSRQRRRWLR